MPMMYWHCSRPRPHSTGVYFHGADALDGTPYETSPGPDTSTFASCSTIFSPQGPDSHYGTKGLRKVTHESPTTGAKTCFTFCYAAGNNNGTSVEDGQIPEVIFYT